MEKTYHYLKSSSMLSLHNLDFCGNLLTTKFTKMLHKERKVLKSKIKNLSVSFCASVTSFIIPVFSEYRRKINHFQSYQTRKSTSRLSFREVGFCAPLVSRSTS